MTYKMAIEEEKQLFAMKMTSTVLELQLKYVDELPEYQREKIRELRSRVSDVLKPQHNDYFLLKWLKARKFVLNAAEAMLRASLKWREDFRVDHIHEEFKPNEAQRLFTTQGMFGEDKEGNPVWIFPIGNIDVRGIYRSAKMSDVIKYFIYILELNERATWRQTEKHGKAISKITAVFDLDNFKLKEFIWKPAFEIIIQLLKIFEGNYPELLHKGLIFNAPKIFTIFYAMCKPFISEETKNKLVIFGRDNWKEALLEAIDPDQLPKYWGGNAVDELDGNSCCTSKISMGGVIPESYYISLLARYATDKGVKTANIDRGGKFTVDVPVKLAGSTLTWCFQTQQHDIGFGIMFQPDINLNNTKNESSHEKVWSIQRINCDVVPEDGEMYCEEPGTYTLIFDNSFSWYRGKEIFYEVHLLQPEAEKQSLKC